MTTTVIIALATMTTALVAVAAGVYIARAGRRLDDRFRRSLTEIGAEIDALSKALGASAERLGRMSRVSEALARLGAPTDLSDALTRLARAATTLCLADAGLVHGFDADGTPVVATAGMPVPGVNEAVGWPAGDARVMSFTLDYPGGQGSGATLRTGVAVRIAGAGAARGTVAVYWRDPLARTERTVADLEALAERAVVLLEQDWRSADPEAVDALTALGARRAFHKTVSREVAHAHQHGSDLALIALDVDNLQAVNRHVGHLASDRFLADVASRIREISGADSVAFRIGGDEFGLILRQTSFARAEAVFARVQEAMPRHPSETLGRLGLSAGIAELRPDDDAITLVVRADAALMQAKQTRRGSTGMLSASGH